MLYKFSFDDQSLVIETEIQFDTHALIISHVK